MKAIICLTLFLLMLPAAAQKKVEKTIPYTAGKEIHLNLKYASDIRIKVWDRNEIAVNAAVNINGNTNNNNFDLETNTTEQRIQIKSVINDLKRIAQTDKNVNVNDKSGHYYDCGGYWDNENRVYINAGPRVSVDIDYEITVPAQANVRLKTISGDVDVDYRQGAYQLETISGKIDLKAAANARCNFSVSTVTGDVYTNLSLEKPNPTEDGLSRVGGKFERDLKLNSGGEKIRLKTISGDIYLRKQ